MTIVVEPSTVDGPEEAEQTAAWLRARGISASVSRDFEGARQVWPDVWTSPIDPRLQQHSLSCLADYLLEHRQMIGVTGTAGKTTTAWLVSQLLPQTIHHRARAQNLWPGPGLLERPGLILAELTSSHLAFCRHSPGLAAITNFWPDHLEIHGSLQAYAEAKSRLFRFQRPQDIAVLPWHDQTAQQLAELSPARRVWFSTGAEPAPAEVRVWPHRDGLIVDKLGQIRHLKLKAEPALLCALAVAAASGLDWVLPERLERPAQRACRSGRCIDDTLAATPRKAAYSLFPGAHLVAGGLLEIGGQPVHSAAEEQPALDHWLARIRQHCATVDLFGPAGEWLHARLPGSRMHTDFLSAVRHALEQSPDSVLISPGFPMPQEQRRLLERLQNQD
ncbi:MAG: Mur ligase family protein [Vulcanimicrobiota bacterium]